MKLLLALLLLVSCAAKSQALPVGVFQPTEYCRIDTPNYKEDLKCRRMLGKDGRLYVFYIDDQETRVLGILALSVHGNERIYISKELQAKIDSVRT